MAQGSIPRNGGQWPVRRSWLKRVFFLLAISVVFCHEPVPPRHLPLRLHVQATLAATGARDDHPRMISIQDGEIAEVSPGEAAAGRATPPQGTVDARALVVTPGLAAIAMATSLRASPAAIKRLLRLGITSLVVVDSTYREAIALRRFVGTARGMGPRIFVTGPVAGEERNSMRNKAQARARTRRAADAQVDAMCLSPAWASANPKLACSALAEAARHELRSFILEPVPDLPCAVPVLLPQPTESFVGPAASITQRLHTSGEILAGLGLDGALGRVERGYRADLVGFSTTPCGNRMCLAEARLVLIDGVVQNLDPPPWYVSLTWLWHRTIASAGDDD